MKTIKRLATLGICSAGLIPNCSGNAPEQKRPNIKYKDTDEVTKSFLPVEKNK